jgi:hypothetical protein
MENDSRRWRFQEWDSIMVRPSPHTTVNTLAAVFTKTPQAGEPLTAVISQYEDSGGCLKWYTAVVPTYIFNAEKEDRDKFPAHTSVVNAQGARDFLLGLSVGENDMVFQQVMSPRPKLTGKEREAVPDIVGEMITDFFSKRGFTGATYDAEGRERQLPHRKFN